MAENEDLNRRVLQRQIDATDREIDRLVDGLDDLTPVEIALVEGLSWNAVALVRDLSTDCVSDRSVSP